MNQVFKIYLKVMYWLNEWNIFETKVVPEGWAVIVTAQPSGTTLFETI